MTLIVHFQHGPADGRLCGLHGRPPRLGRPQDHQVPPPTGDAPRRSPGQGKGHLGREERQ